MRVAVVVFVIISQFWTTSSEPDNGHIEQISQSNSNKTHQDSPHGSSVSGNTNKNRFVELDEDDDKRRVTRSSEDKKSSNVAKKNGISIHKEDPHRPPSSDNALVSSNDKDRGYLVGIPDLSDHCFLLYENCIVINAQPYERRSSSNLGSCKRRCMDSQVGVYSCRSFVYDNINQVCDLFAHAGDQAPARLLKFQTRDYFEPTFDEGCDQQDYSSSSNGVYVSKSRDEPPSSNETSKGSCSKGKVGRFLHTEGFELHDFDHRVLDGTSIEECLDACAMNQDALGNAIDCHSLDFSSGKCVLSTESSVPIGNGQLKLNDRTDYYEKICIDQMAARDCPRVFDRYPQKILVGFAEIVIDSPSFEHCFDNCVNSLTIHGIKCASGMFYYEEAQLNCILNSEDRTTQKDLFTDESSDIVDYFEVQCGTKSKQRRFKPRASRKEGTVIRGREAKKDLKTVGEWSAWNECSDDHIQIRTKTCGMRTCAREVRRCKQNIPGKVLDLTALKEEFNAKGIKCKSDVCCPVFGGCRIGLIQNRSTNQLEWCQNPCDHQ